MRRGTFVGVGLAVFILGATYLSLRYPPDMPSFMVVGSGWAASGEPTALRVRARMIDARSAATISVERVQLGDRDVPFEAQGTDPVTLSFRMPVSAAAGRTERLRITATALERTETLEVPIEVLTGDPSTDVPPTPPPKLRPTDKAFRLSLIAEGAGVVARLENSIYVKVRSPEGQAVAGAKVTISHSALPDGKVTLVTDGNGLAVFTLEANRPSYTLKMKVAKGEASAEFEETISPAGRQVLLRAPAAVLRPGETEDVEIDTWRRGATVFCDLRRGAVWLWSRQVDLGTDGSALTVGPLAPGRYDLQCYFHAHTPGSTWATLPIIVGDGDRLELLRKRVEREEIVNPAALDTHEHASEALASGYFLALLNQPPMMPTLLANTREADQQLREDAWDAKKRLVLIALGVVFVLVVLLVFDLILANILAQRDRMRAFAADVALDGDVIEADGDELDDLLVGAHKDRDSLVRTRGIVLVILVGGTIVANLIAFILLMVLIR
ncbi:MAG: hypothetical protein EP329_14525 [Deltaproteobacteria bacterium]|nr:MAG: hypothetical protein EP329_14525 [Deltaproteobacteria bacterium]